MTVEEILGLCDVLDPERIPGRLTFICRMGADQIDALLPPLIEAVKRHGCSVVWICDPMHGNTFTAKSGYKTREFSTIAEEVMKFIIICRRLQVVPGGLHLELTGDDVTECRGGSEMSVVDDLSARYLTQCDPRLSGAQSLELAFLVAGWLRDIAQV
jgi:3-deoxy-7-phosphoheptulonate synthase